MHFLTFSLISKNEYFYIYSIVSLFSFCLSPYSYNAIECMQTRICIQAKDQWRTNRPPDCTQCYRDIFRAGCRRHKDVADVSERGGGGRERRTIRRFATLKFHDYVGSNFGWSRGWCSRAVSLSICVLRATESGDGGCRVAAGAGKEVSWDHPESTVGKMSAISSGTRTRRITVPVRNSRKRPHHGEGWRNSMTDGGTKIFRWSDINFLAQMRAPLDHYCGMHYLILPRRPSLALISSSDKLKIV